MFIKNISLKNFRNIKESFLDLNSGLNILIGHNGQGKTNLVEAIHFLIEGESFRYGDYLNTIQLGHEMALVKCLIQNNDLDYQVLLRLFPKKKELLLNDKKTTQIQNFLPPVILFSPESLSIIKESHDERRKLLDQLIQTNFKGGYQVIQDFKKALRSRNKVLKDLSEQQIDHRVGLQTLESLNVAYFKHAVNLTALRIKALQEIKPLVQKTLNQIENKNEIIFDFSYIISDQKIVDNSEENLHNLLKKRAIELQAAELAAGVSLVGPQKHDVIFLYNGNDSRFFCSQGQQRSIILSFKIAQIVYHHMVNGFYPILILDDVLSELDQNKQAALVMALEEIKTQTFITSTDIDVLKKLKVDKTSIFNVTNGIITKN